VSPSEVTAVVVTRGGYDISEVIESLAAFREVIVWDNSERKNLKVFGRYAEIGIPRGVVYTQDDDVIVDAVAVCAAYQPGVIVANSSPQHREINAPFYRDGIAPIGWGSVFDARLIDVLDGWERDDLFLRECDRVFTALNKVKFIEVPFGNLPRATAPDRMWRERRHLDDLAAIRGRILRRGVTA